MVDAGEYLPCDALSKKGLLISLISELNAFDEIPFDIALVEKLGVLTYETIAPVSISIATTAPRLLFI